MFPYASSDPTVALVAVGGLMVFDRQAWRAPYPA